MQESKDDDYLAHFSKAKIFKNDYSQIIAEDLTIFKDKITFVNISSKQTENLPLDEINLINGKTGNYCIETALLGGLLSAALAYVFIQSEENTAYRIISYSAIGGVAGGFLVGLGISKYDTIYHNGEFYISFRRNHIRSYLYNNYSIQFNFCIN